MVYYMKTEHGPTMKQVKQVSEREKGILYILDGNSSLVIKQRPILNPFQINLKCVYHEDIFRMDK